MSSADLSEIVEGAVRGIAEAVDDSASVRAYEDRNLLALALATRHKRGGGDAGYYYAADDDTDGWPVVWATLETGQVSWHLPPKLESYIEASCLDEETPVGGYDDHDRRLKNDRLAAFATGTEGRVKR